MRAGGGRGVLPALAAALALAAAAAGAAPRTDVALPPVAVPLSAAPPFPLETRAGVTSLPGRVSSSQVVLVTLAPDGTPVAVRDRQTLVVRALGDYVIVVPGPIEDVVRLPASGSDPGLRDGAVIWQGFSPGDRTLAAEARLELARAAPALPVRVHIAVTVDGRPLRPGDRASGSLDVRLEIEDATALSVRAVAGVGDRADAARVLDGLRAAVRRGVDPPESLNESVGVLGRVGTAPRTIRAPLRLEGRLALPEDVTGATAVASGGAATVEDGDVHIAARLVADGPSRVVVHVRGTAASATWPSLRLVVVPEPPRTLDPPDGAASWRALVRAGPEPGGAELLDRAVLASLTLARVRQYDGFLQAPDPASSTRTRYVLATGRAPAVPVAATPAPDDDGASTVVVLLVVLLAGAAAAGVAAVAWAHS